MVKNNAIDLSYALLLMFFGTVGFFGCGGGGGPAHFRATPIIQSHYYTAPTFRQPVYTPVVSPISPYFTGSYNVPYRYHGYNCGCTSCVRVYRGSCFLPPVRLWLPSWPRLHFPSFQCGLGEGGCYYDQVAGFRTRRYGWQPRHLRPYRGRLFASYMAPQVSCDVKGHEAMVASQILPQLSELNDVEIAHDGSLQVAKGVAGLSGSLHDSKVGPEFVLSKNWQQQVNDSTLHISTQGRGAWRVEPKIELQGLFVSGVKIDSVRQPSSKQDHCVVSWGGKWSESADASELSSTD